MHPTKSELEDIREMLVDIQLALSSSHNTITTDDVSAQPDETHWRINHKEYLEKTNKIADILGINLCSSPRCVGDTEGEVASLVPTKNTEADILTQQANGCRLLQHILSQANLKKDQLDDIKLYLNPNEFLNSKKS
ncbi:MULTISPECIES: hypothetical protein [unclassified Acinetobacter]|uniref:hypothetical protein n=1 Tax=unclassified Acinetobacter TaxID=196816 RepID=UPI00293470AD|nr:MULTISPECIES: hypothetical protein [unclassified Acinetobacter]WOE32146.1 hypothetical protein QSG84_02730 [Acinetobacter sp. SAAs470]WOE37616.1 hypothetical protein QSG86_11775 [Acinetobacter sp. SAAs474]